MPAIRATLAKTLPPKILNPVRLEIPKLYLSYLLRTELVEASLVQSVDGLPTCLSFTESHWVDNDYLVKELETLSPGAWATIRAFWAETKIFGGVGILDRRE
jgi:hypothetical protein